MKGDMNLAVWKRRARNDIIIEIGPTVIEGSEEKWQRQRQWQRGRQEKLS